ncbi:MAG: acyl-CoA dehydratase activase [Peptococcaceae bacterium]|jgi:predicted CoA-substrate-specific enzyme activase|nr:acyl-CoA dehydratase activase [Peptococcaceae bacterium]
MITAGVDAGLMNTKIAVLKDGKVIARAAGATGGGGRREAIEKIWAEALKAAGADPSDVSGVAATGIGREDVSFAGKTIVESLAAARAARFLYPGATSVVDAGADQTRVVTLGEGKDITEVVLNQKCMAGLGLLLEVAADRLEMTLEEMSALGPETRDPIPLNDGCPVFAEQGALELLNKGVPKKEVADAVTDVAVVRLLSILNDKVRPGKDSTVLIGGLTKNAAVTERLKRCSGIDFLIPEAAEYGGALGAAVFAAEQNH